jgi:HD superfamily phosphohydrolase
MPEKLFRDPLYDYIAIDKDSWLLKLIACPEVQRLRYISQLGLSQFTYPGAIHSRFSHCLGALHLMKESIEYLQKDYANCFQTDQRDALLAATLLHDIGHGPFSHATESFFKDHERRGVSIIMDSDSSVHKELTKVDKELPAKVAALIAKKPPKGVGQPTLWQRALISSQLDADRLDFLRRDSLFSGAEYGNFDWYRIIHTMKLKEYPDDTQKTHMFWPDKTKYAIEEYLFSRFYMYQSVYFHHTTRGFEKLLEKILTRARWLASGPSSGFADSILSPLRPFFKKDTIPTPQDFLGLTDYLLLAQIWEWQDIEDDILSDLARLFFARGDGGFKVACEFDFTTKLPMMTRFYEKEDAARAYLQKNNLDPDYYLLKDEFDVETYKPYAPEPETSVMSPENVIWLADDTPQENIREISQVLPRLQPIAKKLRTARYYCPAEHKDEINRLLS